MPPDDRGKSFWRMPPPWVWLVFSLAMSVFCLSMLTFREGRRFVSRQLQPREVRVVAASLALWQRSVPSENAARLRAMLQDGRILAMDQGSFSRAQERATFGYTDEHSRILLNPNLCFASQRARGLHQPDSTDTVATLFTLFHESRHLFAQATEATAYEEEWHFAQACKSWPSLSREPAVLTAISDWEEELPCRIELYVDKAQLAAIRSRVDQSPRAVDVSQGPRGPQILGERD